MANNIDNRIIQMKFDNEQFESAVAKTMDTLDKFKEKLKFDGSNKGLDNLGKSTNNYNYSLNDIGQSLDQLNNKFSTMGNIGRRVIENLTDSAYKFATKGIGVITGSITQGGLNRAKNLEQARFQLQGIFHDATKVKDVIYSDVLPELRGTPFGLDEAAVVVGQLAASGVQADEDIKQATRAMAGLAAMSGKSFQDVGAIFSKVAGQGNLMGGELQRLSAYGINAAADLAKYFTKVAEGSVDASDNVKQHVAEIIDSFGSLDEASVREAASKRMVYYEDLVSAMDTTYGAHAKAANDIFSGAFSNFKAALARIGAEPAAVGLEFMRNAFNAMTPAVDAVNDVLTPFTSSTREIIKVGDEMKYAGAMSGSLANSVLDLAYKFQGLFVQLDDSHQFMKYTEDNIDSLTKTVTRLDEEGNEITEHFTEWGRKVKVGDNILNDDMWKIVSGTAKSFVNIIAALGNALGAVGRGFRKAMPKVTLKMIARVVEYVEQLTESLNNFVKKHLTQFQDIAQAVFTPLGIAVRIAISLIELFGITLRGVFAGFRPIFNIFLSGAGSIARVLSSFGTITDQISAKAPQITKFVTNFTTALVKFLQLEKIAKLIKIAFEGLAGIFGTIGSKVGSFIGRLLSDSSGVAKAVSEFLHLKEAGDLIYSAFSKFKTGLAKMLHFDEIKATIDPIIDSVKEFFKQDDFLGLFVENIQNLLEKIKELEIVQKIIDSVSTAFENLTTKISGITASPAKKIKKWLRNIGQNFKDMFGSYKEGQFFATVLANISKSYAKFGDAQASFEKKVKPFIQTGKELVLSAFGFKSFSEMFAAAVEKIKVAAKAFASFIGLIASGGAKKSTEVISELGAGLSKTFGGSFAKLVDSLAGTGRGITVFIEGIKTAFSELDSETAHKVIKTLALYLVAFAYLRQMYKFGQVLDNLKNIGKNIAGFSGALSSGWGIKGINNAIAKVIKLIGLAFALVLFAKALQILGTMDVRTLITGGIILLGALIAFTIIFANLSKEADKAVKVSQKSSGDTAVMKMAAAVATMAVGVFILATAMEKIGKLTKGEFWKGLGATLAILLAFGGIFTVLSVLDKKELKGDVSSRWNKAAFSIVGLAKGVEMMAVAIEKIGKLTLDPAAFWQAVTAIVVLMAMMVMFAASVKADAKVFSAAIGMMVFAEAIVIITKAVNVMSEAMKGENFLPAVVMIGLIMGVMAEIADIMGRARANILAAGAGMFLVATAIAMIAGTLALIGLVDQDVWAQGLTTIAVIMGGLAVIAKLASGDMLKAGGGIILLAFGLLALASAFMVMSQVPFGAFILGLIRCAAALVVFGAGLFLLSKIMDGLSAKGVMMFLLMATAILELAVSIKLLAGLPLIAVAGALGVLAIALLLVGGVLAIFSGLSVGLIVAAAAFALLGVAVVLVAAGMFLFVTALAALVPLLLALGSIDINTLNAGLEVLKTAASGVAEALGILAGGIVKFGLACLVAGVGVLVLGAGFLVLGASGIVCALALLTLAGAVSVFVVTLRELFGEGLIAGLGNGLGKLGSVIKKGFISLFTKSDDEVYDAAYTNGEKMADKQTEGYTTQSSANEAEIRKGAQDLFGGNDDLLKQLAEKNGMDFSDTEAMAYITESGANSDDITSATADSFGGIDISSALSGKGTAGANALAGEFAGSINSTGNKKKAKNSSKSLASASAQGLKGSSKAFSSAGSNDATQYGKGVSGKSRDVSKQSSTMVEGAASAALKKRWGSVEGSNAGSGYTSGVKSWAKRAADAAAALVRNAKDAAKREQDSNSPSKDYIKFGGWAAEGYIIGMQRLSGKVAMAASDMVGGGLDAVTMALSDASSMISSDMDFVPTITPVVDLTNVSQSADRINSMFGSSVLPIGADQTLRNLHSIANDFTEKAMNNADLNKTLHQLTGSLDDVTNTMNSRALNNYITVDGSTDPEAFADDLIRSFRLNVRTV